MTRTIVTGLDVGTSTVRIVVSEVRIENGSKNFSVLGSACVPAGGVRRGAVVDVEETSRSIRGAVDQVQQTIGLPIHKAYIAFGGAGLSCLAAKGTVAVSRADGEVNETDMERVQTASRSTLPALANREMLHEIVTQYTVDKEVGIRDPRGMIGNRLDAHMIFLTAFTPHLRNLVRSVEDAGITVEDVIASPLASAQATLSKHQCEIGVLHLDLGGGTAACTIFEEGSLFSAAVFPVGANHITHDIAIGFQLPLDVAEEIKVGQGVMAGDENILRKEIIRISDIAPDFSAVISRKDLAEIIEARTADIFELVGKHLRKIGRNGLLPAGIILTGGGSQLPGIAEFARRELRLPCDVGVLQQVTNGDDYTKDPGWSVAVGICKWGSEVGERSSTHIFPKKIGEFFVRILRPLIP